MAHGERALERARRAYREQVESLSSETAAQQQQLAALGGELQAADRRASAEWRTLGIALAAADSDVDALRAALRLRPPREVWLGEMQALQAQVERLQAAEADHALSEAAWRRRFQGQAAAAKEAQAKAKAFREALDVAQALRAGELYEGDDYEDTFRGGDTASRWRGGRLWGCT